MKNINDNILFILTFIFIATLQIFAQNNPDVSNVAHTYNSGTGYITITYSISDLDDPSQLFSVSMKVSDDGGATWDYSCAQVSGDIGAGISTGDKTISWNHDNEHGSPSGSNFIIKIIATDNVAGGEACPGTATVNYGSKIYHTIQIGDQCWLRENLDVGNMINSADGGTNSDGEQTNNGTIEKYCQNNDVNNCNNYGGLYQWGEAMQYQPSDNGTTGSTQGICPPGWHFPTLPELLVLKDLVESKNNPLKAVGQGTGSGAGTNTSGFAALLGGYRHQSDKSFYGLTYGAYFWSSYGTSSVYAYHMSVGYNTNTIYIDNDYKNRGFSVRCIKD